VLTLGVGLHTARFHLREGGARLDTLKLVDLNPHTDPAPPGEVVEAEDGLVAGGMAVRTDPTASGGEYVSVVPGVYANGLGTSYAEYRFQVATTGTYRLDARVHGPAVNANSFFVTVNSTPATGYLWEIPAGWVTDSVSDRGIADPVVLNLNPGVQVVRFYLREGGARLDTIMLVDISPTVFLPGQTVQAEDGFLSGNFAAINDLSAQGGKYVAGPVGQYASAPGNHFVEFRYQVNTAGVFRIDTVVNAPSLSSDSFFVTVDGAPSSGYLWDLAVGPNWVTSSVKNRNGANPVLLTLGVGEHVVRFHLREGGARLDSLVLVAI
jgi:hypothetical protein